MWDQRDRSWEALFITLYANIGLKSQALESPKRGQALSYLKSSLRSTFSTCHITWVIKNRSLKPFIVPPCLPTCKLLTPFPCTAVYRVLVLSMLSCLSSRQRREMKQTQQKLDCHAAKLPKWSIRVPFITPWTWKGRHWSTVKRNCQMACQPLEAVVVYAGQQFEGLKFEIAFMQNIWM